jgi:hypothetical protein
VLEACSVAVPEKVAEALPWVINLKRADEAEKTQVYDYF